MPLSPDATCSDELPEQQVPGYPKLPGQINVVIMYQAGGGDDSLVFDAQEAMFLDELAKKSTNEDAVLEPHQRVYFYQTDPSDEDIDATLRFLDPDFVVTVGRTQCQRLLAHAPTRQRRMSRDGSFTELELCNRVRRVFPITRRTTEDMRKDIWSFLSAMVRTLDPSMETPTAA